MESEITVQLKTEMAWTELGNLLNIQGILLGEGTFTGIDGTTIHYPAEVIKRDLTPEVVAEHNRIWTEHGGQTSGFMTKASNYKDIALGQGYIFDREAIKKIKSGEITGLSPELIVKTERESEEDTWQAVAIKYQGVALVSEPACDFCKIGALKEVQLRMNDGEKDTTGTEENKPEPGQFVVKTELEQATVQLNAKLEALEAKMAAAAEDADEEEVEEEADEANAETSDQSAEYAKMSDRVARLEEMVEKLVQKQTAEAEAKMSCIAAEVKDLIPDLDIDAIPGPPEQKAVFLGHLKTVFEKMPKKETIVVELTKEDETKALLEAGRTLGLTDEWVKESLGIE